MKIKPTSNYLWVLSMITFALALLPIIVIAAMLYLIAIAFYIPSLGYSLKLTRFRDWAIETMGDWVCGCELTNEQD